MTRTAAPRRARTRGSAGAGSEARARLRSSFVAALAADYEAHGATAIAALRDERPQDYVKLVAAFLAKDDTARAEGEEDGSIPITIDVHFVGGEEG